MTDRKSDPFTALAAINPVMAFWSMPYLMTWQMMSSMLSASARKDTQERNSDDGQIPVPPVLQDSNDKELFA